MVMVKTSLYRKFSEFIQTYAQQLERDSTLTNECRTIEGMVASDRDQMVHDGPTSCNHDVWCLYGQQQTSIIDKDADVEALMKRSGRTNWNARFIDGNLEFGSSKLVLGVGVQYTIKKIESNKRTGGFGSSGT